MTKSLFSAGLNWRVVDKKWSDFKQAFAKFSPVKVAKSSDREAKALMDNEGIVRNEKKIHANVHNAGEFLKLQQDPGSFLKYLDSFGKPRGNSYLIFRRSSCTWANPLAGPFSGQSDTS